MNKILDLEVETSNKKLNINNDNNSNRQKLYKMSLIHKLFMLRGRIGRLDFFILSFGKELFYIVPLFLFFIENDIVNKIALALLFAGYFSSIWVFLSLLVKRAHDLNHSGWVCLYLFIPIFNLVFMIYMMLCSGSNGSNKYGEITGML